MALLIELISSLKPNNYSRTISSRKLCPCCLLWQVTLGIRLCSQDDGSRTLAFYISNYNSMRLFLKLYFEKRVLFKRYFRVNLLFFAPSSHLNHFIDMYDMVNSEVYTGQGFLAYSQSCVSPQLPIHCIMMEGFQRCAEKVSEWRRKFLQKWKLLFFPPSSSSTHEFICNA